MKPNTLCWILLLGLTVAASTLSRTTAGHGPMVVVLGLALVKAALVGWQFMDLRTAHIVWKSAFLLLLTGMVGVICLLA
jgi:hypothetical protein